MQHNHPCSYSFPAKLMFTSVFHFWKESKKKKKSSSDGGADTWLEVMESQELYYICMASANIIKYGCKFQTLNYIIYHNIHLLLHKYELKVNSSLKWSLCTYFSLKKKHNCCLHTNILIIPCSANPSLNIYVAYCMRCWCAVVCAACSAMYSFDLQACHPNKAPLCRPLLNPTRCSSSRYSHTDGPDDKTCGNRLSEGSQPATREVTREVKLSLSVPLGVRVDHKPDQARN